MIKINSLYVYFLLISDYISNIVLNWWLQL